MATSLLAVYLGKELNSSPGETLLLTNGETVSTKVIGVNEFFWYQLKSAAEIESAADEYTEDNIVVATGCAKTQQLQNLLNGAVDGTPVVVGLSDLNGTDEKLTEMSSNVYSSGDKTCLESRDGKSELCFSNNGNSNESCHQAIERRLEVETEECGGRHLSRTRIAARRLCATASSLRKLTKNTRPTSLREIHLSENETHLSYVKFTLR